MEIPIQELIVYIPTCLLISLSGRLWSHGVLKTGSPTDDWKVACAAPTARNNYKVKPPYSQESLFLSAAPSTLVPHSYGITSLQHSLPYPFPSGQCGVSPHE